MTRKEKYLSQLKALAVRMFGEEIANMDYRDINKNPKFNRYMRKETK